MQRSRISRHGWPIVWFFLTVAAIAYATRLALLVAPTEATMGNVQRIFYYHVPTSMLSLLFPYVNFVASLCYLDWRGAIRSGADRGRGGDCVGGGHCGL